MGVVVGSFGAIAFFLGATRFWRRFPLIAVPPGVTFTGYFSFSVHSTEPYTAVSQSEYTNASEPYSSRPHTHTPHPQAVN